MSEDVARIVGAPSPTTVTINGKACQLRPLSLVELTEVERECLRHYRKSYLECFADNAASLGEKGMDILERKMEEAARWGVEDLPFKDAFDSEKMVFNEKVLEWLKGKIEFDLSPTVKDYEKKCKKVIAGLLDNKMLRVPEYEAMTGHTPKPVKILYANWWITGCMDGMITFVWVAYRSNGVSREEVARELGHNPSLMIQLSQELERMSAPGNG